MFDLVINIFIIFFIILFANVIIQNQKRGETLEQIWDKYQDTILVMRTYIKIIGIIFICWLSTVNLYLGIIGAILFIVVMEYDYNNEIDKKLQTNTAHDDNKLHTRDNKIDYFTVENSIKSKPGLGVDKSLFSSTSVIDPYDTGYYFYPY
jgi:cellobiose-specific phosphotransferase system component IIC